jgi:hypothetical protein
MGGHTVRSPEFMIDLRPGLLLASLDNIRLQRFEFAFD